MSRASRGLRRRSRAWFRAHLKLRLFQHRWTVVIALWVIVFTLTFWGYWLEDSASGQPLWIPQQVYKSLQLFTFKGGERFGYVNWQFEIARWAAPAIAAYTAAKGLVSVFYQQFQLVRAAAAHRHVIICGLSDKGQLIANAFLRRGDIVVVIESDADRSKTGAARAAGAIVIEGRADEPSVLRSAGVRRAAYLIATCDDDTNMEVLHQARAIRSAGDGRLDCLVHVKAPGLDEHLLQYQQDSRASSLISVRFFNLDRSGARAMVSRFAPFSLDPQDPDVSAGILVTGGGSFVEDFMRALAERWAVRTVFGEQRMTILYSSDETGAAIETSRHGAPALFQNIDVEDTRTADVSWVEQAHTAFVLEESPSDATAAAIDLLSALDSSASLVIKHRRNAGLAHLLESRMNADLPAVSVFSVYEDTCAEPDLLLGVHTESLARLIHARYRREHPGALPAWDVLPETFRDASRGQADWIERILADAGFETCAAGRQVRAPLVLTEDEIDRLAAAEHRRWSVERILEGWDHGPERDDIRRLHPDLAPWNVLPSAEREKDRQFVREWPTMLADDSVRFEVRRACDGS